MSKKEIILTRSTEVFFKYGLQKLSMDELADRIGVSKKTIYNNYGSKDNLLEEIIITKMNALMDNLTEILTSSKTDILEKFSLAIQTISSQYGVFQNAIKLDQNAARILSSTKCVVINDQIQTAVEDITKEAKKKGLVKQNINPEMIPYIFLNIIKGLSSWERADNIKFTKIELMRHTIDIALDGILTSKGLEELHKS